MIFSIEQQRIRKYWLLFLILLTASFIGSEIVSSIYIAIYNNLNTQDFGGYMGRVMARESLRCLIPYVLYRCAYKKPGTRLLTLLMLLLPLFVVAISITIFSFNIYGILSICFITLTSGWVFFSFKLRKVNKAIQNSKVLETQIDPVSL